MSAADDFVAAVYALADALRTATDDPADQVRLLASLAAAVGGAEPGEDLCRRAALIALARATAAYQPQTFEEASALRLFACGLLRAEEIRAADAGEDAVYDAFRALRLAVAEDLTLRAADLAHLRAVRTNAPVPALVLAHRLYADASRADEVTNYAAAPRPLFLPVQFLARDR
jgi:prophage DNA circulation protein